MTGYAPNKSGIAQSGPQGALPQERSGAKTPVREEHPGFVFIFFTFGLTHQKRRQCLIEFII